MTDKLEDKNKELLEQLMEYVSTHVSKFSQIYRVVIQTSPFQKTATLKIKRFLYT